MVYCETYNMNINMCWYLYIAAIVCVGLPTVGGEQSYTARDGEVFFPTKVVNEGDTVHLYCNTTDPHYLKNDVWLYNNTRGRSELHDVEEIFWTKNVTGGMSEMSEHTWTLELANISRRDTGKYFCHLVLNSTGENVTLSVNDVDVQYPATVESMMFNRVNTTPLWIHVHAWARIRRACFSRDLLVTYPATVESMSLGPQVIFANQTFEVNCSLRANPQPVWSIFNNVTGEDIMDGRGNAITLLKDLAAYRIHNQSYHGADVSISNITVKCGDTGFWMCSGYNVLNRGHNSTRGFPLTVLCAPEPKPFFPSDHVYTYKAHVGDVITMSINASADPAPTYRWSRGDGSPLKDQFHVDDTSMGTRLTLRDISVGDFGKYNLQINNIYGDFWAHFDLQAHGAPGKPRNVNASNVAVNSVDLSWVSGFDMGSHQQFYIVKMVKNDSIKISDIIQRSYAAGGEGKVWKYTLTNLDADTDYKLAVVAQNADNITFSDAVEFNTTSIPVVYGEGRNTVNIGAIIGGSVGFVVVAIVVVAIVAMVVMKKRKSANLIGKQRLVENIQSKYGGRLTDDLKKQRLPSDVISHVTPQNLAMEDTHTNYTQPKF